MTLNELNLRARQFLRDTNKTIFEESNINSGINEGIDRFRSIKELRFITHLTSSNQEPIFLPAEYHYLLSVFSASRCFFQDEQMQQATMLMNEFESKLFELKNAIESGDVVITDPSGNEVDGGNGIEYVQDVYFISKGWLNE